MSTDNVPQKRIGRPPTGQMPPVRVRLPDGLLEAVDLYAAERDVNRSEAIRDVLTEWLSDNGYPVQTL